MIPKSHNLFNDIPATLEEELFQTLAESGDVRIERIVSAGRQLQRESGTTRTG